MPPRTPTFDSAPFVAALRQAASAADVSAALALWGGTDDDLLKLLADHAPALETGLAIRLAIDLPGGFDRLARIPLEEGQWVVLARWAQQQLRHQDQVHARAAHAAKAVLDHLRRLPTLAPAIHEAVFGDDERRALFARALPSEGKRWATKAQGKIALEVLRYPALSEDDLVALSPGHMRHALSARVVEAIASHPSATPAVWQALLKAGQGAQGAWANPTSASDHPLFGLLDVPSALENPAVRRGLWEHFRLTPEVTALAVHVMRMDVPDAPFAAWLFWRRQPVMFRSVLRLMPQHLGRIVPLTLLEELLMEGPEVRAAAAEAVAVADPALQWPWAGSPEDNEPAEDLLSRLQAMWRELLERGRNMGLAPNAIAHHTAENARRELLAVHTIGEARAVFRRWRGCNAKDSTYQALRAVEQEAEEWIGNVALQRAYEETLVPMFDRMEAEARAAEAGAAEARTPAAPTDAAIASAHEPVDGPVDESVEGRVGAAVETPDSADRRTSRHAR